MMEVHVVVEVNLERGARNFEYFLVELEASSY